MRASTKHAPITQCEYSPDVVHCLVVWHRQTDTTFQLMTPPGLPTAGWMNWAVINTRHI